MKIQILKDKGTVGASRQKKKGILQMNKNNNDIKILNQCSRTKWAWVSSAQRRNDMT